MLQELKKEANYTLTENGALTYASTMDHCLDLFATAGGLRNAEEEEIRKRFVRAYAENADTAMKILSSRIWNGLRSTEDTTISLSLWTHLAKKQRFHF